MTGPAFQITRASIGDFAEAVASRPPGSDLVVAEPGFALGDHAVLRLSWSAERMPGIAVVSPLVSDLAGDDLARLDRWCAAASTFDLPECAAPPAGLVYIRAEAIEAVGTGLPSLERFLAEARRLRFTQRLATDIVIGAPHGTAIARELTIEAHPDLDRRVADLRRETPDPAPVASRMRTRRLHLLHGWGGGAADWVRSFCAASESGAGDYVLRAASQPGRAGIHLDLFRGGDFSSPLETWPLSPPITATALSHEGYRAAITAISERYGIGRIVVSSLAGHSLDALRTGLPTTIVCHDYYPVCPAIHATFGSPCRQCGEAELADCAASNPLNRHFPGVPVDEWLRLREQLTAAVETHGIRFVAPAPSVEQHLTRLMPALSGRFAVIPHGMAPLVPVEPAARSSRQGPLRVVVPGRLALHKGSDLLGEVLAASGDAEFLLLGCGEAGEAFRGNPKVTIIADYARAELPALIASLCLDIALLLSIWPEAFSYTLSEAFAFGIVPVATRLGAFADRIEDGVTGFLVAPTAEAVVERITALAADPAKLDRVRENIVRLPARSIEEMVRDYTDPDEPFSARAYFARSDQAVTFSSCRLYWAAARQVFEEARSLSAPVAMTASWRVVRMPIPAAARAPHERIRFDFASRPGFVAVRRIAIRRSAGEAIWLWEGGDLAEAGVQLNLVAPAGNEGPAVRLYMVGTAPSLAVTLDPPAGEALRDGGWIEVELSYPDGGELMWDLALAARELRQKIVESPAAAPSSQGMLAALKAVLRQRP